MNWRYPRQTQILPAMKESVNGELLVRLVAQDIRGEGTEESYTGLCILHLLHFHEDKRL